MSAGTTPRAIRVTDDLWDAAQKKARRTGESVTSVLVARLTEWVAEDEADAAESTEPYVGMPATIHLVSDSIAAVVVRVNAKSISVAAVATDPDSRRRINADLEPYPCIAEDGVLTEVIGKSERYQKIEMRDGQTAYRNGSISVSLGRSVKVTDYRY